jgi:hypothetical protein
LWLLRLQLGNDRMSALDRRAREQAFALAGK